LRGMRWPIKRSVKKEPLRERIFHAAGAGNQDDLRFKTVHGNGISVLSLGYYSAFQKSGNRFSDRTRDKTGARSRFADSHFGRPALGKGHARPSVNHPGDRSAAWTPLRLGEGPFFLLFGVRFERYLADAELRARDLRPFPGGR
jgi:hypothetical protein